MEIENSKQYNEDEQNYNDQNIEDEQNIDDDQYTENEQINSYTEQGYNKPEKSFFKMGKKYIIKRILIVIVVILSIYLIYILCTKLSKKNITISDIINKGKNNLSSIELTDMQSDLIPNMPI